VAPVVKKHLGVHKTSPSVTPVHQIRPTDSAIGQPVCTETGKETQVLTPTIQTPVPPKGPEESSRVGKSLPWVCSPEEMVENKGTPITLPELPRGHYMHEGGTERPMCKVEVGKEATVPVVQNTPKKVLLDSVRIEQSQLKMNINDLLMTGDVTSCDCKMAIFTETIRMFSQYNVSEEVVLYSTIRNLGMTKIADTALEQTKQLETLLYDMDQKYGNGIKDCTGFRDDLIKLRDTFNIHANLEENEIFPQLENKLSNDDVDSINKWFDRIKVLSPTHPHPGGLHSPAGKLLTGPVLSFVDRFRDLAKHFTIKTP